MATDVVFISGKDPVSQLGGHPSYVRAHARAAISCGFLPHLFCVSDQNGIVETDYGIVHRVAPFVSSQRQVAVPFLAPLLTGIVERFLPKSRGRHLVHGFGLWGDVGVSLSERLRPRGIEVIPLVSAYTTVEHEAGGKLHGLSTDHRSSSHVSHWAEYWWTRVFLRRIERRLYLKSRLVLFNYDSVKRLVGEAYGENVKFHKVTYSPESAFLHQTPGAGRAEPPETLAALDTKDSTLIVAVSRHDPRKGIDVLLRALAELRSSGVAFRACLVGGGVIIDDHRRLASQLRLDDLVTITGWVKDSFAYIQRADIFVLPSLEEGSGSVALLEALQAGVAAIASNVDGIPEDVVHEESAILVEPRNVTALSQAIARLVKDEALRKRLAIRAREVFDARFSAEAFSRDIGEVYAQLGFAP